MTNTQFELALEFLGTIDAATGMLLDGLDSYGGLDYTALPTMDKAPRNANCQSIYPHTLQIRDHSQVKQAFARSAA